MTVREEIFSGLFNAFEGSMQNEGYSQTVVAVSRYDEQLLASESYSTPLVMFIDLGTEEITAVGGGYARYRAQMAIRGYVIGDNADDLHALLNDVLGDIKHFAKSVVPSTIHEKLLSVTYSRTEQHRFEKSTIKADCQAIINVTYVDVEPPSTPITVTGSAWIDEASDLLYARLAGTGLTRYQRRDQAWMTLPAVTVGFEGDSMDYGSNGTAIGIDNNLTFTVRVHAAYGDGFADSANIQSMLNSVINELWARINLQWTPVRWRIASVGDVQNRILFEESDTIGGQVTVVVNGIVEHTQE